MSWALSESDRMWVSCCVNLLIKELELVKPTAAYTSDSLRCIETANLIDLKTPCRTTTALREKKWGNPCHYKKMTTEEYLKVLSISDELEFRPPAQKSESILDRFEIIKHFLFRIIKKNLGGNVLLCTHSSVIKVIQMVIGGYTPLNYSEMSQRNCGICCIQQYRLRKVNIAEMTWEPMIRTISICSVHSNMEWQIV